MTLPCVDFRYFTMHGDVPSADAYHGGHPCACVNSYHPVFRLHNINTLYLTLVFDVLFCVHFARNMNFMIITTILNRIIIEGLIVYIIKRPGHARALGADEQFCCNIDDTTLNTQRQVLGHYHVYLHPQACLHLYFYICRPTLTCMVISFQDSMYTGRRWTAGCSPSRRWTTNTKFPLV